MRKLLVPLSLVLVLLAGCPGDTSTPPGAGGGPPGSGGPPGMGGGKTIPANAISAGQLHAVPPAAWGEVDSAFGAKSISVDRDEGSLRIDFFTTSSGDPSPAGQVARFQKMIEPASAVKTDEIAVAGTSVQRVSGLGTRRTLNDKDEPSDSYPDAGLIGVVFGQTKTDLLIMVSGDAKAVEAFGPEFESWIKSFK